MIDSLRASKLRRYVRGLEEKIWQINTGRMDALAWEILYRHCLVARSLYGYMPREWQDRMRGAAETVESKQRDQVLPLLRGLLEEVRQELAAAQAADQGGY